MLLLMKWTSKDFSPFNRVDKVPASITTGSKYYNISAQLMLGGSFKELLQNRISKDWTFPLNSFNCWLEPMTLLRKLPMILATSLLISIWFRGKWRVRSSKFQFLISATFLHFSNCSGLIMISQYLTILPKTCLLPIFFSTPLKEKQN